MAKAEATFRRRDFLAVAGAGVAALAWPGPAYAAAQKPNIILINIDDLGWTDLGCFGSRYYETLNIDRLAAQGMKFTNAYAACAVCSPTRAAIMTGRYPARLGLTDWIHFRDAGPAVAAGKHPEEYVGEPDRPLLCPPNPYWMDLDEVTIAELLKPLGYATCHIGKWHLGPDAWFPDEQGFDINIGGCDLGQPPSYYDPYFRKGDRHRQRIPTLEPRQEGEYLTDREGDEGVRFIRDHAERPFFLNLWHYALHTPLQGKKSLVEKYKEREKTNHDNPVYAAMIESVDDAVGEILGVLDELGLAERTLVIFTSDNGGLLGHSTDNHPLRAGKGYPYEGGIRIPQIVRWTGVVAAGGICHEPVSSIDFLPTICEASGAALPGDRPIDGVSLMPLGTQECGLDREALFWHFPHYRSDVVPYSIIRAGKWKLIKRYEGKTFELLDLEKDLSEERDLSESMPEKVAELDAKLTAWLENAGAKLPRRDPEYQGDTKTSV